MTQLEELETILNQSHSIVFFTGAGVSTDSGIPDFRSQDGLYHQKYAYPAETILSHTFFLTHTEEFYAFYRDRMLYLDAQPNSTHMFMADLEAKGKALGVVTQNIDGLHQKAGSHTVAELHGSVLRNHCMDCGAFYGVEAVASSTGIPHCPVCGGIIKPDVTLYEEALDNAQVELAVSLIRQADTLLIAGTSLAVYPAAYYVQEFHGSHLVIVNKTATPYDQRADLCIQASFKDVFPKLQI